jgi:hypothetical protein
MNPHTEHSRRSLEIGSGPGHSTGALISHHGQHSGQVCPSQLGAPPPGGTKGQSLEQQLHATDAPNADGLFAGHSTAGADPILDRVGRDETVLRAGALHNLARIDRAFTV